MRIEYLCDTCGPHWTHSAHFLLWEGISERGCCMKVNLGPTHGLAQLHGLLQAWAYLGVLRFLLANLQSDGLLLWFTLSVQLIPRCSAFGLEKTVIFLLIIRSSHILNVDLGFAFSCWAFTLLDEEWVCTNLMNHVKIHTLHIRLRGLEARCSELDTVERNYLWVWSLWLTSIRHQVLLIVGLLIS